MIKVFFSGIFIIIIAACSGSSFKGGSAQESVPSDSQSSDVARAQILDNLAESGITDAESLSAACLAAGDNTQNITRALNYPERRDCNFGVAPNLQIRNSYIQAFETSGGSIQIPNGAVICNMTLKSEPNARIHYDDFLFLTIEGQIIFASNQQVASNLEKKDDLFQWDWNKLMGKEIRNFESPYYCLGNARECVLPPHDQAGPVSLELKSEDVAPLAFAVAGKPVLAANLIATGDNDDEDCMHTDLNLSVEIEYIQAIP